MYEVLILLVVVNLGFTNYKPVFLDVVPVLAFARSGQFDGFPKHLLVFLPHRASRIRFQRITAHRFNPTGVP